MNGKKSSALRSLKRNIDQVSSSIQKTNEDIPKIVTKGYPAQMAVFYGSKLEMVVAALKVSKELYAHEVMIPNETDTLKKTDVEKSLKSVEEQIQELDKAKKTFDT